MIEETYVSFETAKLLKEKGFGECSTSYISEDGDIFPTPLVKRKEHYPAPTQQMAMRWLREVHNLHVDVDPSEGNWNPTILELENWSSVVEDETGLSIYDSYEEAVEAALKYCLEHYL